MKIKMKERMITADWIVADDSGTVMCYNNGIFLLKGKLQDVTNLFPESIYAFQGLIVRVLDETNTVTIVKLPSMSSNKTDFKIEFFHNETEYVSSYSESRMRYFDSSIALAKLWRLDLGDDIKKQIVSMYKSIRTYYGRRESV